MFLNNASYYFIRNNNTIKITKKWFNLKNCFTSGNYETNLYFFQSDCVNLSGCMHLIPKCRCFGTDEALRDIPRSAFRRTAKSIIARWFV